LVELLLVTALLVLLLGAVAFNFSTVQRNAELDEGASQFESLLRYARAHAASTGCRVRVTFEEDAGEGLLVPLGNFSVTWEPDPLGRPDEFVPLPETATLVASILDVISIQNVRPPSSGGSGVTGAAAAPELDPAAGGLGFAPIVFLPDGSADPVEVTIAARSGEDARRMVLKMSGLTGNIRRRTYVEASMEVSESDEAESGADAERGDSTGNSTAVPTSPTSPSPSAASSEATRREPEERR
jgi:type II secretory pathway pseudopilin PulG